MTLFNACRNFSTWICRHYGMDQGKGLIHLGAVGWFLSSLAQIHMIKTNKEIAPEKKKFLIPQEAADCAVNVGLFYTVSSAVKKYANHCIENGKYYTPATQKLAEELQPHSYSTDSFIQGIHHKLYKNCLINAKNSKKQVTDFYKGMIDLLELLNNKTVPEAELKKLKSTFGKVFENISQYDDVVKAQNLTTRLETAEREFVKFKSGVGTIAAIAASVLASSIITPIIRNQIANKRQEQSLNSIPKTELKPAQNIHTQMKINKYPLYPTFNMFKM